MDIVFAILFFVLGAYVVAKGADYFIDASSWVSDVTGISKVLIGATVIAIATSGPELFVSVFASMAGQIDMSTGNIIGSHLCNLGIGFALIAIFRPSKNSDKLYLPNSLFALLTVVLLFVFYFFGNLNFVHGIILLAIYGVFTFVNIRFSEPQTEMKLQLEQSALALSSNDTAQQNDNISFDAASQTLELADAIYRNHPQSKAKKQRIKKPTNKVEITINLLKFVLGLAGIILGSRLIVDNATILAKAVGVSEKIIGLTIVAIGTSLPEIATTVAALIKKENDLGIGNIFGSCVFNNAFIIPISAFIVGSLGFDIGVLVDLPVAILLTLVAIVPTAIGKKIYRFQGISIAAIYLGYLAYLVISAVI